MQMDKKAGKRRMRQEHEADVYMRHAGAMH
jgi:hypothetical protein